MSPFQGRLVLFQALVLFHLAELALRIFPFQRVLDFVVRRSGTNRPPRPLPGRERLIPAVRQIVRVIRRFDYQSRPDCLPKALTVYYILARRGVPVEFIMGVRKRPFAAHAWVVYEGEVVSDYTEESTWYTPLMRIPARGPEPLPCS